MLFLLEQAVIGEIVDLHRVTDAIERTLSGLSGDFAALLENLVDFGQATLPLRTALTHGRQQRLHDVVQELLYLHIAESAALVVRFQLVEALVVRQEFCEVLRLAECIQIGEHGIALQLAGILHADVVRIGVHGHVFSRTTSSGSAR